MKLAAAEREEIVAYANPNQWDHNTELRYASYIIALLASIDARLADKDSVK